MDNILDRKILRASKNIKRKSKVRTKSKVSEALDRNIVNLGELLVANAEIKRLQAVIRNIRGEHEVASRPSSPSRMAN